MSSISIVLRKDRKNNNNEAPIHFRIICNRKVSHISTKKIIPISNWDESKNKIDRKHSNSVRMNAELLNDLANYQIIINDFDRERKSFTTKELLEKAYGAGPTAFFPFAENVINESLRNGKIGTYDKNSSIIRKFKDFAKNSKLTFHDITSDYLKKYEKHLRTKLNNKTNTILSNMKFIKHVINLAIEDDLLEAKQNPFKKYKLISENTSREYLTEEELKLVEDVKLTAGTKMDLHRDLFVFVAYTGGIRISDVLRLKWKNFDGEKIKILTKKTGEQISILVPNKGLEILTKYKTDNARNSDFIFPLLSNNLDLENHKKLDNAISSATTYLNQNLKIIGKKADISKNISSHISRHTWATRALTKGISIDKVSKILGHNSLRSTSIYAKIINPELDKAMQLFND